MQLTPEELHYPVLVMVPGFQGTCPDAQTLGRLFAVFSDKVVAGGLFDQTWIVDSSGRECRIARLLLGRERGFFSWLKPREIRAFELELKDEEVSFERVQQVLLTGLREARDFWAGEGEPDAGTGIDPELVIRKVESARSLKGIMKAMTP